jgi:hypothetical protein
MKMRKSITFPLLLAALGLSACSSEAPPADSPATETAEVGAQEEQATPAAPANATAQPADQQVLPLKVGTYVIKGTPCKDAANAAIRMFDGKGLSGSATKDCRANITGRNGNRFTVDQSCVDTYNGKRASEAQEIVVDAPDIFTLVVEGRSNTYQYCPGGVG